MMDAEKFLKEKNRLCSSYYLADSHCNTECPLFYYTQCALKKFPMNQYEIVKIVHVVEEWSKDNPVKTNFDKASEIILKAFPNLNPTIEDFNNIDRSCFVIKEKPDFWNQEYKGDN